MHCNAIAWEHDNLNNKEAYELKNNDAVPLDRPCDMCGKPVDKGYVHKKCVE